MNILQLLILGVIQGITEWLPVSSSGHLAIISEILGLKEDLGFYVMLHFATLLVLLIYFRKDIISLLKLENKLLYYLIIGTIPIGIIGYFFHNIIESFFSNLIYIGIFLIINSIILYSTKYFKGEKRLNFKNSFLVGLFQAIALLPGISRSGITIGSSLILKIKKQDAINFSFLLAIPAILGATILEIKNFSFDYLHIPGFFAAFITGYITLSVLIKLIKENKFYIFSYYCFVMGVLILIWKILI